MKRLEQIRTRMELVENTIESETVERLAPGTTITPDEQEEEDGNHHPGPATMVRNMIREDVTSSLVKSPIGRFFDNIFVLVTLLALIIVFGVWMKRRSVTHPDDQLKMARAILEKEPSYAWLRARDEMLQPLLDSNALPASKQEIEAMISQADQYDFCDSLPADPKGSRDESSELQRLIRKAFDDFSQGDPVAAREQLEAIRDIAARDIRNVYLTRFLNETIAKWEKDPLTTGRVQLLTRLLEQVKTEIADGTTFEQTRTCIESAVNLYSGDRAVSDQVNQLKELLNQIPTQTAP